MSPRYVSRASCVAVAVLILSACGDDGSGDTGADATGGIERPEPGVVVVHDPVGDADDAGGDQFNVDVETATLRYSEKGLRFVVEYAEPLNPRRKPAELIIAVKSASSFDYEVLKWYDGHRPWIAGEDGVRTGCRPSAKVDHRAGRVVLIIPSTSRCIDDLPPKVEILPMAWRDGGGPDDIEDVTVELP